MKYKEIDQVYIGKKFYQNNKKDAGPKQDPNLLKNKPISMNLQWANAYKNNIFMNTCKVDGQAFFSLDVNNPNALADSLVTN